VNVHPSKKIVHFSREEVVVEKLAAQIKLFLQQSQGLRHLPFVSLPVSKELLATSSCDNDLQNRPVASERKRKIGLSLQPNKAIRVDPTDRKIDEIYFSLSCECSKDCRDGSPICRVNNLTKLMYCSETTPSNLASVAPLSEGGVMLSNCDYSALQVIKECSWVGPVDTSISLVQFRSKLLLFNHSLAFKQMLYHICAEKSIGLTVLSFACPPDFRFFLTKCAPRVDANLDVTLDTLLMKSDMLMKSFKIEITEKGFLNSIPLLLDEVTPNPIFLPEFLAALAYDCDWSNESVCYENVCQALSSFYHKSLLHSLQTDARSMEKRMLTIIKQHFRPTKSFSDKAGLIEITSLEKLYRTFERC
jgi:DNA mismatch repair protein MLH1